MFSLGNIPLFLFEETLKSRVESKAEFFLCILHPALEQQGSNREHNLGPQSPRSSFLWTPTSRHGQVQVVPNTFHVSASQLRRAFLPEPQFPILQNVLSGSMCGLNEIPNTALGTQNLFNKYSLLWTLQQQWALYITLKSSESPHYPYSIIEYAQ